MKLVGNYTKNMRDVIEAAAVSGLNSMFISPPGFGKTTAAIMAGQTICQDNGFVFLPLDPSTPPERLLGAYDPAQMLNGKLVRLEDGTVYDPNGKIIVLDEIFRANDIACDILLHAIEDKFTNIIHRKVFIGTSNHIGKTERVEAFRDRFALWSLFHPEIGSGDVSAAYLDSMIHNGSNPVDTNWVSGLPAWNDVLKIRALKPTQKSADVITDMVRTLATEAKESGFQVNPRREVQWTELLFFTTAWKKSSNDFTDIPSCVSNLLQYAYPITDMETASKWKQVALSVYNTVASAVEAAKNVAYQEFLKISQKSGRDSQDKITELGEKFTQFNTDLVAKFGKIPEVEAAVDEITTLFRKAVLGESLE